MDCKNHYGRAGVNTCSKCGDWICEECTVYVEGRNICKNCIQQYIRASETSSVKGSSKSSISGFLVFIFSFLPGAAHMYMGLSKVGLMFLTLFMGSLMLAQFYSLTPLALTMAGIIWVYCFFDARNMKHRLLRGEVRDDITPYVHYVKRHKNIFALVLIIMGAFVGFQELNRLMDRIVGSAFLPWLHLDKILFAAIFIIGGLWLIGSNRKTSEDEDKIDLRDHTNH
ncbi:MAG: hypothetical protein GX238_11080 [Epulopiscium sp.]|nr:hypothetical protein [Candidatus Epulonipiscium sp.]